MGKIVKALEVVKRLITLKPTELLKIYQQTFKNQLKDHLNY